MKSVFQETHFTGGNMQEYEEPNGNRFKEVLSAKTDEELQAKLRKMQKKQEALGNRLVNERMLTPNSKCTCGSGKKIKKCCRFIR
jgi:uncharacterized protein YaaR (DUF327 family)